MLLLQYFVWLGCADCLSGNKCLTWKRFTFIETICLIVIICEANGRSHFVLLLMKDWTRNNKNRSTRSDYRTKKFFVEQGRSHPKHVFFLVYRLKAQPMERWSSRRAAKPFCCHNTFPATAYQLIIPDNYF